jgi:nitrile hydratase
MFGVGDRVRTRLMNPAGHTRLPAYLRGCPGRIEHLLGTLPFSDRRAAGLSSAEEPAYTVRFSTRDVWGAGGDSHGSICADLFEPYLEAAE